jgi:hypothetical protein
MKWHHEFAIFGSKIIPVGFFHQIGQPRRDRTLRHHDGQEFRRWTLKKSQRLRSGGRSEITGNLRNALLEDVRRPPQYLAAGWGWSVSPRGRQIHGGLNGLFCHLFVGQRNLRDWGGGVSRVDVCDRSIALTPFASNKRLNGTHTPPAEIEGTPDASGLRPRRLQVSLLALHCNAQIKSFREQQS